jgi:hypothetical protein
MPQSRSTRSNGGGNAAGRGAGSGGGGKRGAASKTTKPPRKKYTGVVKVKTSGSWLARYKVGGKSTSLGSYYCEDEAACAWDRMRLWSCKDDGEEDAVVEEELNFPLSDYSDDKVLQLGLCKTQWEMFQRLRRTGHFVGASPQPSGKELTAHDDAIPAPVAGCCVSPHNKTSRVSRVRKKGSLVVPRTFGNFEKTTTTRQQQQRHAFLLPSDSPHSSPRARAVFTRVLF